MQKYVEDVRRIDEKYATEFCEVNDCFEGWSENDEKNIGFDIEKNRNSKTNDDDLLFS